MSEEKKVEQDERGELIDRLCGQLAAAIHFVSSKDFDKKEALALIDEARAASTSANVAQGAEAIYQVRRNKDEEKMWSDAYEATHYACSQRPEFYETRIVYTAPPAQTATTDDARDAARWRWFTQNYGALNLHEKFAGNTPRVFTHGLKGRSWGEITRTIDAALTAAQSGDKS